MQEFTVPRKTLYLWQFRISVIGLVLILLFVYLSRFAKGFLIGGVAVLLVCLAVILVYLPCFFKNCRCRIIKQSVVVERGVFIKTTTVFPFSRLIYTQTFTTPIAKCLGITCVGLKAARRRLFFPELTTEDSEGLTRAISGGKADES